MSWLLLCVIFSCVCPLACETVHFAQRQTFLEFFQLDSELWLSLCLILRPSVSSSYWCEISLNCSYSQCSSVLFYAFICLLPCDKETTAPPRHANITIKKLSPTLISCTGYWLYRVLSKNLEKRNHGEWSMHFIGGSCLKKHKCQEVELSQFDLWPFTW